MGEESTAHGLGQVGTGQQGGADIGEQCHGEPAKDGTHPDIGAGHLDGEDGGSKADHEPAQGNGQQQVGGGAEAAQVGGGFDGVAANDRGHDAVEHDAGAVVADDGAETLTGDLAELGREINDDGHHRHQGRGHPQGGPAQASAYGGIGADGGGVIVGGAGDQAQPQGTFDRGGEVARPATTRAPLRPAFGEQCHGKRLGRWSAL